ncbi:MAG: hypothetical protein M0Z94_09610 [Dehalococcoidales bacterium]|nr:hypothetical protein [Dehalococcoidales bacterium]
MAYCDLCSAVYQSGGKRYSPREMRAGVRAGFRLPVGTDPAAIALGVARPERQGNWLQAIMTDPTDWHLCPSCAANMDRFLKDSGFLRQKVI